MPGNRPKNLRDKLVLAWVAYHEQLASASRGKAECHLSIRHLEMIFSFSSTSVAEKCLDRLKSSSSESKSGWLVVSTAATGVKGHHYRLGARARGEAEEWFKVGQLLFSPGGLLDGYRTRPVFRGKGLGPEGCLVLAAVDKMGPATLKELIDLLLTYLSETTIRKRLRYLATEGLISQENDKFFTRRTLAKKIDEFESAYDLINGHIEHHRKLLKESLAFQISVQGGEETVTLKSALRKMECFYCGKKPRPKGEDAEHFPPKTWGGNDRLSFLLPACRKCHRSHGPILGRNARPPIQAPEEVLRVVTDQGFEELSIWIAEAMLVAAHQYASALNRGDVETAYSVAASDFPVSLWIALRVGKLRLVSPVTGEIAELEAKVQLSDLESQFVSFQEITKIVSPKK